MPGLGYAEVPPEGPGSYAIAIEAESKVRDPKTMTLEDLAGCSPYTNIAAFPVAWAQYQAGLPQYGSTTPFSDELSRLMAYVLMR